MREDVDSEMLLYPVWTTSRRESFTLLLALLGSQPFKSLKDTPGTPSLAVSLTYCSGPVFKHHIWGLPRERGSIPV